MIKATEEITFNQKLGAMIRTKRKELGMSQTDMAKLLGITFQQFQKYESGESAISLYKLHKISIVLETSFAAYIFGDFPELDYQILNKDKIKSILCALELELF